MSTPHNQTLISIPELNRFISTGKQILATQTTESGIAGEYAVVDYAMYTSWKTQVLNYLKMTLTEDNHYYLAMQGELRKGGYPSYVHYGIQQLLTLIEDIQNGVFLKQVDVIEPVKLLSKLFDKFHSVAVQLRKRHNDRPTLDISDEYDVQDLLHALLKIEFNDIQPEDWTPSYAGTASRLDFALREHDMVIEVKKTRASLKNKDVANQLIIDIERYRKYTTCKHLLCFVYDPDGYISNPTGFENDLSRIRDGINVLVMVRPKL